MNFQFCILSRSGLGRTGIELEPGPRQSRLHLLETQLFPWTAVISPNAAVSEASHTLFANMVQLSSLLDLANHAQPTNSIDDAVLLNKLVWYQSLAYTRPPDPSYCSCLLYFSSPVFPLNTTFRSPYWFGSPKNVEKDKS